MQHSSNGTRLHKVKNRNNQLPNPYNSGVHFLTTANDNQPVRTQVHHKFFNNIGKINEVSVMQYNRTSNFQIKNSNQEVRYFPNRRHQQPVYLKPPQYQNHLNLNFQPSAQIRNSLVKQIPKDQQNVNDTCLPNTHKNKENTNTEQGNTDGRKNNEEYKTKFCNQKVVTHLQKMQSDLPNNEDEKSVLNNVAQNPSILHTNETKDRHIKKCNKESNGEDNNKFEKNIESELNISKADTDVTHIEEAVTAVKSTREKTPMCLINDLARFNKISFQYRLTSENGPAHCKRFTVTLKLGDEEYTAEGFKIKKAQHLAAKEAIEKTKYKHPIPKTIRNDNSNAVKTNITPTVELNALAMKLGQQTYYIFDPSQMDIPEKNNFQIDSSKNNFKYVSKQTETTNIIRPTALMIDNLNSTKLMNNDGKHVQTLNQKTHFLSKCQNRVLPFPSGGIQNSSVCKMNSLVSTYFPSTSPCKITLIVGTRKFEGVGRTLQQAKHNAASNALQVLKEQINSEQKKDELQNDTIDEIDNKSPISLVFEIGIKRNLPVDFKVLREEGPAHMRTFITACLVGDFMTEGEGTGKKISKKRAAQKMLEELSKLPPIIPPITSPVKKVKFKLTSKKCESDKPKVFPLNSTKEDAERLWNKNKKNNYETEATNPITKLLEWHQNRKEKEPVFKLINEGTKENTRRRQFVMEVTSNNITARGVGPNKKLAKRDAAHNFMIAVNERDEHYSSSKNSYNSKTANSTQSKSRKENVKYDTDTCIRMPDEACNSLESQENSQVRARIENPLNSFQSLEDKESQSATLKKSSSKNHNLHMKDQLLYLAKLLGFEVEFSDYPKGNHNEFLSIVMLSTNPPQICHGVGTDAKESQEDAAKNALRILSEMGLNNAVKS